MAACVMSGCLRSVSKIERLAQIHVHFTQDDNTASPVLNCACVVLNVESGSTLFRMILFARFAMSVMSFMVGNELL